MIGRNLFPPLDTVSPCTIIAPDSETCMTVHVYVKVLFKEHVCLSLPLITWHYLKLKIMTKFDHWQNKAFSFDPLYLTKDLTLTESKPSSVMQ